MMIYPKGIFITTMHEGGSAPINLASNSFPSCSLTKIWSEPPTTWLLVKI